MHTRREFHAKLIGSAITFSLIETLWARDLFAADAKPTIGKWVGELAEMTKDLKGQKLTDLQFQTKMEDLYKRVDLADLCALIKLDDVEKKTKLPDSGAANVGFDLSKVEGLPADVGFGKQIFGCKKGRSIVPHGHANMCTGFIVLKGQWHGRHYDRIETKDDHYVIKPTIDRDFKPGELSTISDHKDKFLYPFQRLFGIMALPPLTPCAEPSDAFRLRHFPRIQLHSFLFPQASRRRLPPPPDR